MWDCDHLSFNQWDEIASTEITNKKLTFYVVNLHIAII
jgi:hypothetical protein